MKDAKNSSFFQSGWSKIMVCLVAFGFISGFPVAVSLGSSWVKNPLAQQEASVKGEPVGDQVGMPSAGEGVSGNPEGCWGSKVVCDA